MNHKQEIVTALLLVYKDIQDLNNNLINIIKKDIKNPDNSISENDDYAISILRKTLTSTMKLMDQLISKNTEKENDSKLQEVINTNSD